MHAIHRLSLTTLALSLIWTSVAQSAPDSLDWNSYNEVKTLVAPRKDDFVFKRVKWTHDLPSAITKASEADKPLLLWLYFGNPQGNC